MERRDFLRVMTGAVLVLPVGTFLLSCGGGEDGGDPGPGTGADAPAAAPRAAGAMIVYASSSVAGHHHEFELAAAALASPPAPGVSGTTSLAGAHAHSVTVSMAQLADVETGATVKITTGAETGHTHVLTLVKLSSATPTADAQPGPAPDAEVGDDPDDPYEPY